MLRSRELRSVLFVAKRMIDYMMRKEGVENDTTLD